MADDKTCKEVKNVLDETIDELTTVAKKSCKKLLLALLEKNNSNFDEILDHCGRKLKEKVKTDVKIKVKKSQ